MIRSGDDAVCDGCARRTWLLGRLAGHLDVSRARVAELLGLPDAELIAAVAGTERDAVADELAAVDPRALATERVRAGVRAHCRCDGGYPDRLRELPCPPAVLHVVGPTARLAACLGAGAVAIVGSRAPSPYGRQATRAVAGGCARAGLCVVSGLALGVDGRAHEAALAAEGLTVAVMPGGAERPYPASHRALHARVCARGVAVSELGPGTTPRRWMFPARNRIIAALSEMTVVVQARAGSGALLTADWASTLHRRVGAVPGPIEQGLSEGPHELLRAGACMVAGAGDVLDALYGEGGRTPPVGRRPGPPPPLDALLRALADGYDTESALRRAGLGVAEGLTALASLELSGHVLRTSGGGYAVAP